MTVPLPVIRLTSAPASGLALSPSGVSWSGPSHDAPGAPSLSWRIGPAGAESLLRAVAEGDAEVLSAWVLRVAMPQGLLSALAQRCLALQPDLARSLADGDRPSDLRWARTLACAASSRKCLRPEQPEPGLGLLVRGEGGGLLATLATPAEDARPALARLVIGAPPGPIREASVELSPGARPSLSLATGPWGEGLGVALWSPAPPRPGLLAWLLSPRGAVLAVWLFSSDGDLAASGACLAPAWAAGSEVTALLARGSTLYAQTHDAEIELPIAQAQPLSSSASPYRRGPFGPAEAPPRLAPPPSPPPASRVVRRTAGAPGQAPASRREAIDVAGASFFVDGGAIGGARATVRASDGAVVTLARCRIGEGGVEACRHATVFLVDCAVDRDALSADRTSHIVAVGG